MKKVGIVTIIDNNNYGNRLQNYAVQQILKSKGINTETLLNHPLLNNYYDNNYKYCFNKFKVIYNSFKQHIKKIKSKRYKLFKKFNKNIKFSSRYIDLTNSSFNKRYDYFVVGSDQVWNPNFNWLNDVSLLTFADNNKKISFSASFGVNEINDKEIDKAKKIKDFKGISVREDAGKKIIEKYTERKDCEVLLDPTMLVEMSVWDEVLKKPKQLNGNKYILNYFLGELSEERKNEIDRIAKENNCDVINILDKQSPFYQTGPSEFLYLEKNAFLICTDSFHSSVFAILYNKPFIVFTREDNTVSMNSRIETLINKFKLKNRVFEGKITKENLKHDYTEAYKILKEEREKASNFLKDALDLK